MSDKKKKKKRRNRLQYEQHVRALTSRKAFLESMRRVFDALRLPNLFLQLPKEEREMVIENRFRPLRLHVGEEVQVSRRKLDMLRFFIAKYSTDSMMPVLPGYGEVTVKDFFTAGLSIFGYALANADTADAGVKTVVEKMTPFATQFSEGMDLWWHKKLVYIADLCGRWVSRVNESIYHVDPESYHGVAARQSVFACSLKLCRIRAQCRNIMIDGKNRPVYRVGWAYPARSVEWASITARELGKQHPFAQLPLEVYIQSHAIMRMRDRLDTFHHFHLNHALCVAFSGTKEVVAMPGDRALVAYRYREAKLGYFLVEITDGLAVIRTFLFITNSGTPEGEQLDKELKIGKMEKELFALDRLSSFVGSDLMKGEKIRNIFTRAQLGHLCDLDPRQFITRNDFRTTGYTEDFFRSLQQQP